MQLLVVGDGTTDTTAEIVQSFAQKDSLVSLFHQSSADAALASNLAIENSKGEYIARIHADDI
ncbi:glycosyltransferase [Microcoleus sp. M2_B4]|uniref:glycosyltransferase n=1 Tax=unclassified Microcoleus TaxID=2642155 RepID=UPI002FD3F4E4